MKFIFTLLLCGSLFACSSTKIHLYTRYLAADDVAKITQALEVHDFDVVSNTLKYPDDIMQSTLLYSPFMQGENRIDELINTLDDLGWVIPTIQPLVTGNHYYTKNSAGLLLLPEGGIPSDKVAVQDLANDYQTENCQVKATLCLSKDNTYHVFYPRVASEKKSSTEVTPEKKEFTGKWQVTSYPYIELTSASGEWPFYFEIERMETKDKVSKIDLIELKPMDKRLGFPACSFFYGLRI